MPLPVLLLQSQTMKAHLLHYVAPSSDSPSVADDNDTIDSWCSFHKDHSMLTGLCSAMYLAHFDDAEPLKILQNQDTTSGSGLYICTRGGDLHKVHIPTDYLAFQIGGFILW
jgi:hypothetical protein